MTVTLLDFLPGDSYSCGCSLEIFSYGTAVKFCLKVDCSNFKQISDYLQLRAGREIDKVKELPYREYDEEDEEDEY